MMQALLDQVLSGYALSRAEAESALEIIKNREAAPEQIGALLGGLRTRGETADEVAGFAAALLREAVEVPITQPALDCCGTGGDGSNSFNISTTVAFVLAAGGVHVAKHGNRSVSSRCGSADVLEHLGISVDLPANEVAKSIDEQGFGFIFAPLFHPAVKAVMPIRKALGVRTVFNLLGPLINPARVKRQVVGVYRPEMTQVMAEALGSLGAEDVMVVSSRDGLDEISICDETYVSHWRGGKLSHYSIAPESVGLSRGQAEDLRGGGVEENARILIEVLEGVTGAKRDIVLFNAAAGFFVAGISPDLASGVEFARDLIDRGEARRKLESLRK